MRAMLRGCSHANWWILPAAVSVAATLITLTILPIGVGVPFQNVGGIGGNLDQGSAEPTGAQTLQPMALPPRAAEATGAPDGATVNPTGGYTAEPAPMGIADFGIGHNGNPYSYNSSEFLGNFTWQSLDLQKGGVSEFSIQLNVVLEFVQHGTMDLYWVQDVCES